MDATEDGGELPGLHKSGRIISVEITFGEFVRERRRYFTGMARDISERKRAKAEREAILRSEQAARAQAESAVRTREEVLAIVSHDLRNPLNAIIGNASLLLHMPLHEQQRKWQLKVVKRSAERMKRLDPGPPRRGVDRGRPEAGARATPP